MATAISPRYSETAVSEFLARKHRHLINGKWVEPNSGKTFITVDPATGETLSHIADGNAADIDAAVKAARNAFDNGPWRRKMTPAERGKLMWKLADLIDAHTEELAQLESLDNGKPLAVARAADVPLAADNLRYFAGWTTKIEGNTVQSSVPYTPGARYPPTRCASRLEWSARSSRGISRCLWRHGNSVPRSPRDALSS